MTDEKPKDEDVPAVEPEEEVVEPVKLLAPDHADESGGWPNDWPVWQPKTRVRAKRIDQPFTIATSKRSTPHAGEAGDYAILHIDEHGEVAAIETQSPADFEASYDVVP